MSSERRILWADLHNHNEIGYGQGSLERSYRIAENTLDVYALTVHGHWPDPPADDPALARYHTEAFERIGAAFPEVVRQANLRYRPGVFVPFIGYEWHSIAAGDYVVLFPGETGELFCANTVDDLQVFARERGALMIPHHMGYRLGLRGSDWSRMDYALSPLVEIFSEHGSSWEREDSFPMLAHSMGGVTASQTAREHLAAGRHFGFTAGTDTHYGYPGSHGEGLTGIYSDELTRESVFAALRERRTLAVTGDRIEIWVEANGAGPGDVLPAQTARSLQVQVNPLGPLDYVEVIKNGRRAHVWPFPAAGGRIAGSANRYLTRVEWGWGRLQAADETDWKIHLKVAGGTIRRAVPCFSGGAGSVTKASLIHRRDEHAVEIESFTSRRNPFPICGVVVELEGDLATRLSCDVGATVEGRSGGCRLDATLGGLGADDVWGAVEGRFSSPRIRLGRTHRTAELGFSGNYHDAQPGPRDTYVVKARQTNGQTAWASPLLFAD